MCFGAKQKANKNPKLVRDKVANLARVIVTYRKDIHSAAFSCIECMDIALYEIHALRMICFHLRLVTVSSVNVYNDREIHLTDHAYIA